MTLLAAFIFAGLAVRACRDMPEVAIVFIVIAVLGGVALFAINGGAL